MTQAKEHAEAKAEEKRLEQEKAREERLATVAKQKLDKKVEELHDEVHGKDKDKAKMTAADEVVQQRWANLSLQDKAQLLANEKYLGEIVTGSNDKRYSVRVPRDPALPRVHIPAGSQEEAVQRYDELLGVTDKEHVFNDHEVILLTL